MGLYSLDETYSISTWYDYNGAYDLNAGTDLLLEQTRQIIDSDAYVFQGVSFPKGNDISVGYQQTFSGSLNLIPYSFILGVTGYNRDNGFYTVRIFDKGAQTDLYYGQFGWYPTVVGTMQDQYSDAGNYVNSQLQNQPFGPYFFRAPLIVLPPGILQIQVTNAVPFVPMVTNQLIQMLFLIAAPKNTVTLSTRKVQTPTDQTGLQSLGTMANLLSGA